MAKQSLSPKLTAQALSSMADHTRQDSNARLCLVCCPLSVPVSTCQLAAGTWQLFVNVVSEYVSWEALHLAKIVVSEQSS